MGLGLGAGGVGEAQAENLQQGPGAQQQGYHGRRQKGPEQPPPEGAGPKVFHAAPSPPR